MGKLKQTAAKVGAAVKNTWGFINGSAGQKQLNAIKAKKEDYLSAKGAEKEKDLLALERNLQATRCSVFRSYLPQVKSCYEPPKDEEAAQDEETLRTQADNRVMRFDITKWVEDPRENSIEKLSNVYQSLCSEQCAVALIYHRRKDTCKVTLAVANHAEEDAPTVVQGLNDRLRSALRGNFPGSEYTEEQHDLSSAGSALGAGKNVPCCGACEGRIQDGAWRAQGRRCFQHQSGRSRQSLAAQSVQLPCGYSCL